MHLKTRIQVFKAWLWVQLLIIAYGIAFLALPHPAAGGLIPLTHPYVTDFLALGLVLALLFVPAKIPYRAARAMCLTLAFMNIIQLGPFYLSLPRFYLPYRVPYMQLEKLGLEVLGRIPFMAGRQAFFVFLLVYPTAFLLGNIYVSRKMARAKYLFKEAPSGNA